MPTPVSWTLGVFGVLAWSCPAQRDVLHLNDDGFVVEILDAEGRPAAAGTVGELVVTSLGSPRCLCSGIAWATWRRGSRGPAPAGVGSD
jgi:hypothetical protein